MQKNPSPLFDTTKLTHTSTLNTIMVPQYKGFDHALHYVLTQNGEEFVSHGIIFVKHPKIATETATDYWHKKFVTLIGRDFEKDTMYVYQTHIDAEALFQFLSDMYHSDEGRKLMGGVMTIGGDPDDD